MSYLELCAWIEEGGGSWEYHQFCQGWALMAEGAAERQDEAQAAREDRERAAQGLRGGRVHPSELGPFDDGAEEAA